MNTLDQLDPLPKFEPAESNRQKEDWRKAMEKADGTDWTPIGADMHRNGRGQLSYRPPTPPGAIACGDVYAILQQRYVQCSGPPCTAPFTTIKEHAGSLYGINWILDCWIRLE